MNKLNGWNMACAYVSCMFAGFSIGVLYKSPDSITGYIGPILISAFIALPASVLFLFCHMALPDEEGKKPSVPSFILFSAVAFTVACLFCGVIL